MAATLRASPEGLKKIDSARRKKGWNAIAHAWCMAAHTSPATLKRFRQLKPVEAHTFINICQAVGVEWEDVVDKTSSPSSSQTEWYLVLTASVNEIDRQKVEATMEALKQALGIDVNITIKRIEPESTSNEIH